MDEGGLGTSAIRRSIVVVGPLPCASRAPLAGQGQCLRMAGVLRWCLARCRSSDRMPCGLWLAPRLLIAGAAVSSPELAVPRWWLSGWGRSGLQHPSKSNARSCATSLSNWNCRYAPYDCDGCAIVPAPAAVDRRVFSKGILCRIGVALGLIEAPLRRDGRNPHGLRVGRCAGCASPRAAQRMGFTMRPNRCCRAGTPGAAPKSRRGCSDSRRSRTPAVDRAFRCAP